MPFGGWRLDIMEHPTKDFTTPLLCMTCGQGGTATWEAGRLDPVGTSDGFYLRITVRAKVPRLGVEIVCVGCGAIHRDEIPGAAAGRARKTGTSEKQRRI